MARTPATVAVAVVLFAAAVAQLASAGFPNQYWPAPSTPSTGFPTYGWENAHATFYGSDSGLGHDFGGACGYSGSDIASLYSTRTAAMSTPLFAKGDGCGRCYEIRFCRVPCQRSGGVQFCLMGNPYWLLVHVNNVGGGGDIGQIAVRETGGVWIQMTQNWGITFQAFFELDRSKGLQFMITGGTDGKTMVVGDAVPAWWSTGLCYQGSNNFW
uniref:Expansin n=1 Tax=Aegilops tauschii TaxID=37682 RepID=M8BH38_AEGTA